MNKLTPLISDLNSLGLSEYLLSNDFSKVIIKLEMEEGWSELLKETKSKQSSTFDSFENKRKNAIAKTFTEILSSGLEPENKAHFDAFIFEILNSFIKWKQVTTTQFIPIQEDLEIINFPQNKLNDLLKKLSQPIVTPKELEKNTEEIKPKKSTLPIVSRIFISHSSKDKAIVDNFTQKILRLGLEVAKEEIFCSSIEGMGIRSGDDFRDRLKNAITNSEIVIILISQSYKESEICLNEMGAAWVLNKKVIPIIIPPLQHSEVGALHITDHIDRINTGAGIDNIIHSLKDHLEINLEDVRNLNKHRDEFLNTII